MTSCVRVINVVAVVLAVAAVPAMSVHAQDDWPAWGREASNQRHSPLTQINVENVSTLVPAWRYEMPRPGVPSRPAQSTPLMVDGVLYLSFPYYRVVALEAVVQAGGNPVEKRVLAQQQILEVGEAVLIPALPVVVEAPV